MDDCRLPKDIVMEIFLGLPVKSVFKFKCVSKECNIRLSEKSFCKKYKSKHPQSFSLSFSGLFHHRKDFNQPFERHVPVKISFMPFCRESMAITSRSFPEKLGFLLGCSNGLVLCGFPPLTLYVCNPVTDQWLKLPPSPNNIFYDAKHRAFGLLYEDHDTTGPSYTVVRTGFKTVPSKLLEAEAYSSKTRTWKASLLKGPIDFMIWDKTFHIIGGVFYWVAWRWRHLLVAHDPKAEHEYLWVIDLNLRWDSSWFHLGEKSDGRLLFGRFDDDTDVFKIFLLQKPLHEYNPSDLVPPTEFILTMNFPIPEPPPQTPSILRNSVVAFHPQDSRLLLIRHNATFFWYNYENGDITSLQNLSGSSPSVDVRELILYFQPEWPLLSSII